MKAYFISGLAADGSVFSKLKLPHHIEVIYLDWLPVQPCESLQQYSLRLAQPIKKDEPFVLIGLSFGGIVAIEISKVFSPFKLILISSAARVDQIPVVYRLMGKLKMELMLPPGMLIVLKPFLYWFFGPLSKDSTKLIGDYISKADHRLLIWSLGKISRWRNNEQLPGLVQIHGSSDRVFPISISKADHIVAGGHLCVYDNSPAVSAVLTKLLS
ncbi:alpha/beta hydrolase [Paradesertivirga mongoliensis]|uniref:Alpha/beta hydrolase n=1 Tax=Paradesertivirga mongoliensis TaxID=2100740 RepID=A0ABW4ZP71_9SPHI|nr:alpha/beta hydrolase [Pedobacter mongoliensis]